MGPDGEAAHTSLHSALQRGVWEPTGHPHRRHRLGFPTPRERNSTERGLPPVPAVGKLLPTFW